MLGEFGGWDHIGVEWKSPQQRPKVTVPANHRNVPKEQPPLRTDR